MSPTRNELTWLPVAIVGRSSETCDPTCPGMEERGFDRLQAGESQAITDVQLAGNLHTLSSHLYPPSSHPHPPSSHLHQAAVLVQHEVHGEEAVEEVGGGGEGSSGPAAAAAIQ